MSVIVRLSGLPLTAAAPDIRTFFGGLRIPDGAVNIVGGEEGDAFIGFATDEDARQGMRKNFGSIHNATVRLFLSSRTEMNEVINNARSVPSIPPPSIPQPPSVPPRYRNIPLSPRLEKDEPSRYPSRESASSRFSRDVPPYQRIPPFGKDEDPPRYGRDGPPPPNGNGRLPFAQNGGFPGSSHVFLNGSRSDERSVGYSRPPFQIHAPNYGMEKNEQRKSDDIGMEGRWMNGNPMNGVMKEDGRYNVNAFSNIRQEDADRRLPNTGQNSGMFENRSADGDKRKEESWRSENNRSFERHPVSNEKDDEPISFFGRGPPSKKPLLPSPSIAPPSFPPPNIPSHLPTVQAQKEEVFVELTRLPPDLLRPSVLENFLSPSTPLTLSSVKVVYSPEGIHLSSLVRFTSAMDAFNALKKDGEQGVKIRPSTKEAFESARDGPPPTLPHLPPPIPPSFHPHLPPLPHFPTVPPMGGGMPPRGPPPPNLFNMPPINPNQMMTMGNDRRQGRNEMNEVRGERRRREDSPPRGRREEKRRRSMSPRSKKAKGNRICVLLQNLPFRAKESEIRRLLGPGSLPLAIKKVYTVDNSPSDQWVMEYSSETEAMETVRRRMEMGGRQARLRIIDEPEADRLLKQKFKSPPRRTERDGERRDSFDEKVRLQQEAIEMEKSKMDESSALAGAFSGPVFSTTRGFMRGGRGGGTRGMRGDARGGGGFNNGMRGGRGRGGVMGSGIGRGIGGAERNCLLVSNMPLLHAPQILLEHLRITPSQLVRIDQIAPDAAIIELRTEMDAVGVAEITSGESFPHLNGNRLIVAAMARLQIEEEFNLRRGEINDYKEGPSHPSIDPELVKSIGEPGCVISCAGLPHDLSIEAVKLFFDGCSVIDSSVRMRTENGVGTGECMLSLANRMEAARAVQSHNGRVFRGSLVTLTLL